MQECNRQSRRQALICSSIGTRNPRNEEPGKYEEEILQRAEPAKHPNVGRKLCLPGVPADDEVFMPKVQVGVQHVQDAEDYPAGAAVGRMSGQQVPWIPAMGLGY